MPLAFAWAVIVAGNVRAGRARILFLQMGPILTHFYLYRYLADGNVSSFLDEADANSVLLPWRCHPEMTLPCLRIAPGYRLSCLNRISYADQTDTQTNRRVTHGECTSLDQTDVIFGYDVRLYSLLAVLALVLSTYCTPYMYSRCYSPATAQRVRK